MCLTTSAFPAKHCSSVINLVAGKPRPALQFEQVCLAYTLVSCFFEDRWQHSRHLLNHFSKNVVHKYPSTDCIAQMHTTCMQANAQKKRLEVKQRAVRKAAEQNKDPLEPIWFEQIPKGVAGETAMYKYKGGYWEARKSGNWEKCRDIFGQAS